MRSVPHWVAWRFEPRKNKVKPAKAPLDPHTGDHARTSRSRTWGSFDEALRFYRDHAADGIGFVFAGDGFSGVDLDHCRDAATGQLEPWAASVVAEFGTYTETSPSGTGVKLFCRGKLPGKGGNRQPFEMYDRGQYFTVTGRRVPEVPEAPLDCQGQLDALYGRVFTTKRPKRRKSVKPPRSALSPADAEVIRRACRASSQFAQLWSGDVSAVPTPSEADWIVCKMLAFWVGGDYARIDGLFRQSGLMRPKWDERRGRRTYGLLTISEAVADQTKVYSPGQSSVSSSTPRLSVPSSSDNDNPPPRGGNGSHPLDSSAELTRALAAALRAEGHTAILADLAGKRRVLTALCAALQRQSGERPFFIGQQVAARVFGVGQKTVSRWLRAMPGLMLVKESSYAAKRANEYRYRPAVLNQTEDCNRE
jgi:hypothetical protein